MDSLHARLFLTYLITITVTLGLSATGIAIVVDENRDALSYAHVTDLAEVAAANSGAIQQGTSDVVFAYVTREGQVTSGDAALAGATINTTLEPRRPGEGHRCSVNGGSTSPEALCVAIPVDSPTGQAIWLVAVGAPVSRSAVFGNFGPRLVAAGLVAVVAALGLGYVLSRSVAMPLSNIARAARNVGEGNYDERVTVVGPSEVQDLGRSFNKMTEKVYASQKTLRDFLANISHEIKTPLTSIRGFSGAVVDGTIDDPEGVRHAMGIVNHETGRLLRLVEELLDLSRIESGQVPFRAEAIDVQELLEHVASVNAFRSEETGVSLGITCAQPLRVLGDLDRLEQVFQNLVSNAFRYTEAGGRITVSARQGPGRQVIFSVTDTGCGIDPGDLHRVFERFYRSGTSADGNGHGLGLAISREIVRGHGGEMRVESEPGVGARFSFNLPSAGLAIARAAVLSPRVHSTA